MCAFEQCSWNPPERVVAGKAELELPGRGGPLRRQQVDVVLEEPLEEQVAGNRPVECVQRLPVVATHRPGVVDGGVVADALLEGRLGVVVDRDERDGLLAEGDERLEFDACPAGNLQDAPQLEGVARDAQVGDDAHSVVDVGGGRA
jgi:hypothetical protein